jgi:DNA primase
VSQDAKERIRERLDLAEVVGEVVALQSAGQGRLKGLCPFHSEKTPSFHVLQDRGFYYCFGCQAKGDVFDFVMRTQNVDFYEALQLLGRRVGIEVTPSTPQGAKKRDLYEVNKLALAFFKAHLPGPARDYLLGRNLTPESLDAFDLGYAPDSWDALLKHALQKGFSDEDLLRAGLVAESPSGRRYDRFRHRVMFPIKDSLGRVVGFSGRVLDDTLPKYLNTPETEVFKKAELLYGLDVAKGAIREAGECIVVEGYMDVIALHQSGFKNAVAALGATLTADQAAQLARQGVARLLLAFDADEAGQRAVLSGLEQSVGRNFLVRAVQVPFGKDPADAVLGGHVEAFREALRGGLSEVAFRFERVLARFDVSTLEGKKGALQELLPALTPRDVFDPVASEMRRLVVDRLGIDGARLDEWVRARTRRKLDTTQLRGMQRGEGASQRAIIELEVIALLLLEPRRLAERLDTLEVALPEAGEDSLLREFCAVCRSCAFNDREILRHYQAREEGRIVFERLLAQEGPQGHRIDIDGHLHKALSRLRELYLSDEKEAQRKRLLERMQEVSGYLTDPHLPTDQLRHYYAELREINAMLAARDAERRIRVPTGYANRRKR